MSKTSIPKLHSIKWKDGEFAENVISLESCNGESVPVDNVLKGAYEAGLYDVVLLGYDRNGEEYVATTSVNAQRNAYMFGRGQLHMMRVSDE